MHWRTNNLWQAGLAVAALLPLLLFLMWIPASVADAHRRVPGFAGSGTVTVQQATPTQDATMTALNKEKLTQDVDRTLGAWVWSNAAAVLSSFLSTLVVVIGVLIGYRQWRVNRTDTQAKEAQDRAAAQDKELEDRQAERERQAEEQKRALEDRAEERFQAAVVGLGDDKESARIGAAILLRTFLREGQGYEQFYVQTFDLAVANLRLPRSLISPEDPDGLPHLPNHPNDIPLPLTTLSQALIMAFKEAFPLAREWLTKQYSAFTPQTLDATGTQLDNAYLSGTDMKRAWMPLVSMRGADLIRAKLKDAANLQQTDLRDTKGLTTEQLQACKAKGAIIDEDAVAGTPQATTPPIPSSPSSDSHTSPPTPPTHGPNPPPDADGSSNAAPSK